MNRLWLVAAMGIAASVSAQTPQPVSSQQDIEQIEITGQRDTLSLRQEIQHIEQQMFALFNDLNSDDDFDVACGHKTPTGSKLPVWQCEAAFMRDAEARELSNAMGADGVRGPRSFRPGAMPGRQQLGFNYRQKTRQLNDEMKALALQHPELAEAMLDLQAKRQQLDERMKP